jgi:hypothetical protein
VTRCQAFRLQSLAPSSKSDSPDRVAQVSGFSLHAGVAAEADQRGKLERLCRSCQFVAVSSRPIVDANGVIYQTVCHGL